MVTSTESRLTIQTQGDGMTTPSLFQNHYHEMSDHAPPSPRFGSLRRRKHVDYFEDTSEGSDGRTSSDEYESNPSITKKLDDNNNTARNDNQKHRKNSHFAFSNVKKKITSTFQRRHSVAMHPPSPPTPTRNKHFPMRRSSTATSPHLTRQQAIDDNHTITPTRKTSLRRHVTMAAVRLHEQSQMGSGSNPALDRLYQKSQFQMETSSSTPDIQSHVRNTNKLKTFNIHILGSKSVGKTAMTVRFLTGRYIHEYKSATEETYNRVMKYGDENVDVKISINDVENMERDIELDENSGIMILYSIVDGASYNHAKTILHYLAQSSITGYYPVMLIGTKRDLSRMRQVDRKESFQTATAYSCTQFDVSSASNRRVIDSFHALFRQIEIRHLLHQDEGEVPTIVNPPILIRSGTVRYGTA